MSQVTLYLPDALAAKLKREAKRLKMSLSAYVARIATKEVGSATWSKDFLLTYGSCKLPEAVAADALYEDRDSF
jgi:hypothetical protein